jgi:hypothetical protein
MGNTIVVAAEIRINDLPMSRVDQLVDPLYCVQRAAVRPIGILLRLCRSASKIGSSTSMAEVCTTRSRIVGMPNGLCFPSGLGM